MSAIEPSSIRGAITVCIVEDDETYCGVLASLVNDDDDFRCVGTYHWAESAIEGVPRKNPEIVVVDMVLPRMRGTECISRLKERLPKLRALALTGYSSRQLLFEALAAGADGYLEKPCSKDEFLQALRHLRDGKTPLAEKACQIILGHFRDHGPKAFLLNSLTERERQVLTLVERGLRDEEIGKQLGISLRTVNTHLCHIYDKLGVRTRMAAVRFIRI